MADNITRTEPDELQPGSPTGKYAGRTALVTGAAGDIGRAVAIRLGRAGARLILADLATADAALMTTAQECERTATHAPIVRTFDVTNATQVDETVGSLFDDGFIADLVFNNAGYQGMFANTLDYGLDDFRRVQEVNVLGVFVVLQRCARALVDIGRPGAIVNTASMAHGGAPNMVAYSASKAAVVAMTKSAAKDLAPNGIRVNSISPAYIGPGAMWDRQVALQARTPSQYFSDDPVSVELEMLAQVPLRRFGSLDEVAAAADFLLSDDASYITAFDLEISGGST